jgi:DNA-binding MurR/RpiR family transcriptional regulator
VGYARKTPAVCRPVAPEREFFLYGAGFSYLFAEYLTKKLQVLGKTAFIPGPATAEYFSE